MIASRAGNIIAFFAFLLLAELVSGQECIKDSNYFSITYNGQDKNFIIDAATTSQNEIVALSQLSTFSNFVTKFTSQGSVIWSNEYVPNYPHESWVQFPWYSNTVMTGVSTGNDSTAFVYGYTTEHGQSVNNVEEPPSHSVGIFVQVDKFGHIILGKCFGNWRTEYKVTGLHQIRNGNIIVYLSSQFDPYVSKALCVNLKGDIIWAAPIQPNSLLYREIGAAKPVIGETSQGNIVVATEWRRELDDTLIYPFMPPIIIPAPLYYFHLIQINGSNGNIEQETSFQCPPLKNTNGPADFVPTIKSFIELPNGNLSFAADMYLPDDNEIFYKNKIVKRSAANFITSPSGYYLQLFAYNPGGGGPASLESAITHPETGDQLLLSKDLSNSQMTLFNIDQNANVQWTKSFKNNGGYSRGSLLEKQNKKGYFIFQSEPESPYFNLQITDAAGNLPCTEQPSVIESKEMVWPWYVNKVNLVKQTFNPDFLYSPFIFKIKPHTVTQNIDCEYEYKCCSDFIDSLHPHNIAICENGTYLLPDNTLAKDSGTYYVTLKTKQGCDSIEFYNVNILKSPEHLVASPDTCLNTSSFIQLRATEGYSSYFWNGLETNSNVYLVYNPGSFTVKVENACGSKADTVFVYDRCDFPIYFPSAFTPNGDFLNDVLRVPPLNKNKLIRLSIFNRWGKLVYTTTRQDGGWDGTINGDLQPTGVYVYFLEMEGLSGQRLSKKGTVALIR